MITLKSHGFKFSRPEANIVMDVSYFKNPWRDVNIRFEQNKHKRKEMIMEFMIKQDGVMDFVARMSSLLRFYHVLLAEENIQVAFCCSAGEYRSPALVELVAAEMKKLKVPVKVEHNPNSKL